MRRPVEPYIVLLCIPAGLQPSMNALDRFATHRLSMDGMHSAGLQQEGGGRFFYRAMHPSGMPFRQSYH
jgi:hypothetical protein